MTMSRRSTRRHFLQSTTALLAIATSMRRVRAAQPAASYDICEKTLVELQADMTDGRITAERLIDLYLDRIAAYDQSGPRLNAVLAVNPNAAADARALDEERGRRGPRGPLHGIPVLLKDNFDTQDMPTTGGSLALSGLVPRRDAFQVARLREAGVVILGKVNLHELALGLTTVSSLGGQTLNPYDLTRTPGGSSGGSGVATAANLAAFTMGTDTSGSIRIPGAHNCVVGLRPSAGLSSRAGIIPFGYTQDTGGPLTRTVADVAVVLDATAGHDPADPVTAASRDRIPPTYTSALRLDALSGARIGVVGAMFGGAPEDENVGSIVRRAIEDMKARGATAVDLDIRDLPAQLTASNLLSQELKFYLRDYLRSAPGAPVVSVEELLESGLHSAQLQGFLEGANAIPDDYLSGTEYQARLAARAALADIVLKTMDGNRVDAIVYPAVRRIAPLLGGNQAGSNAALSAQTGFPAITVPAGFTSGGFPVGIEMLGRPFAEATLLGLAYAYERATRHRRPPVTTPPLGASTDTSRVAVTSPGVLNTGPDSVRIEVTATGAQSIPASAVPFEAIVRVSFRRETRQLAYDVRLSGASQDVGGIYLHRRTNRRNGGVAHILAKSPASQTSGTVTLTEAEANDLNAGRFYIAAISRKDPRLSARADLVLPAG